MDCCTLSIYANNCLPRTQHQYGQQKGNISLCQEGNQLTFLRFCTGIKIVAWISDVMWQMGKNIGKKEQTFTVRDSMAVLVRPSPGLSAHRSFYRTVPFMRIIYKCLQKLQEKLVIFFFSPFFFFFFLLNSTTSFIAFL